MQDMATGRSHRGVQDGRNRQHHHIALGSNSPFPVVDPHRVNGQGIQTAGIKAQMKVQKAVATWGLSPLTLPGLGGVIRKHRQGAPNVGVTHNALRRNRLPVLQLDAYNAITIQQQRSHGDPCTQAAAMRLKSLDQGIHHRSTATKGIVEMSLRLKPLPKQCGHRSSVGIAHRHPADQEAKQIHPMAKERILEMSIDQWTKCAGEVTHRPEVGQ